MSPQVGRGVSGRCFDTTKSDRRRAYDTSIKRKDGRQHGHEAGGGGHGGDLRAHAPGDDLCRPDAHGEPVPRHRDARQGVGGVPWEGGDRPDSLQRHNNARRPCLRGREIPGHPLHLCNGRLRRDPEYGDGRLQQEQSGRKGAPCKREVR